MATPREDARTDVEVVTQQTHGVVQVDTYTPAPGVTASQLAAKLRAQGVPAQLEEESAGGARVDAGASNQVAAAAKPCWAYRTARLFSGTFCFVRWKRNGFRQPHIRLADKSTGWPVHKAVIDWNRSTALSIIWTRSCAGRAAGVHCITLDSGRYGRIGWVGHTRLTYTKWAGGGYWIGSQPQMVRLNGSYNPLPARGYRWAACHELGHALGLDHTVGGGASCLNHDAWSRGRRFYVRPGPHDFALLRRIENSVA